MRSHIDVASYLLGAIVFLVGFLSARLHGSADAKRQQASDVSWRIRQTLAEGKRLPPSELAGPLSIARGSDDAVASLLRWLNGALLLTTAVVAIDAVRLLQEDVAHPPDALLLVIAVATAGCAVAIIGEIDAVHLRRTLGRQLQLTTLGHISRIESSLASGELADARREIDTLQRAFPEWGLLNELEALISFRERRFSESLELTLLHLRGPSPHVYLSAQVGAAAAVELGQLDAALRILDLVAQKVPSNRDDRLLRRALGLREGHLDELLDGGTAELDPATSDGRAALALGQVGMEEVRVQEGRSTMEVGAPDLPALKNLLDQLRIWNDPEPGTDLTEGPAALLLDLAEDQQRQLDPDAILLSASSLTSGASIEVLGIMLLLTSHARAAVPLFERAISLNPKASRLHWGHAVACWRWGWDDKAHESLGRALALDPENMVLALTRRRTSSSFESAIAPPIEAPPVPLRPSEHLQLALIGIDSGYEASSNSRRLVTCRGLVRRALANTSEAPSQSPT